MANHTESPPRVSGCPGEPTHLLAASAVDVVATALRPEDTTAAARV
jgi:hypothetical protein